MLTYGHPVVTVRTDAAHADTQYMDRCMKGLSRCLSVYL